MLDDRRLPAALGELIESKEVAVVLKHHEGPYHISVLGILCLWAGLH